LPLKSTHITPRYSPLLLAKVTLSGVLEFCDLTLCEQEAACASVTDTIAASPNAAKTIVDVNKDLGMCFFPGRSVSPPHYAFGRGQGTKGLPRTRGEGECAAAPLAPSLPLMGRVACSF
jgi:hypothetical protein